MNFDEQIQKAQNQNPAASRKLLEMQLLHIQVLKALDESGMLDCVVMQGGTCLAGCYGNTRLSSDMDFIRGQQITQEMSETLKERLERHLTEEWQLPATLKIPTDPSVENGGVKRWILSVNTSPHRPDLKNTSVKIEVAGFPNYTTEPRVFLSPVKSFSLELAPVINVESREEILADKIVSFINPVHGLRYRDLYDIFTQSSTNTIDMTLLSNLVSNKIDDYQIEEALQKTVDVKKQFLSENGYETFTNQLEGMLLNNNANFNLRMGQAIVSHSFDLIEKAVVEAVAISSDLKNDLDTPSVLKAVNHSQNIANTMQSDSIEEGISNEIEDDARG